MPKRLLPSPSASRLRPRSTLTAADAAASAANPRSLRLPAWRAPAMTEGPYFVDVMLNRSDIRSDPNTGEVKTGAPLLLTFRVSEIGSSTCTPLAGVLVDVWHCDADGVYSGVTDRSFDTKGQTWLRGYQITDANGRPRSPLSIPVGILAGRFTSTSRCARGRMPPRVVSLPRSSFLTMHSATRCCRYRPTTPVVTARYSTWTIASTVTSCCLTSSRPAPGYAATFDLGLDLS